MKILPLILFSTSFFVALAQVPSSTLTVLKPKTAEAGNSKLTGVVVDSVTLNPISYATISILSSHATTTDGTICNEKGHFSLLRVPSDNYTVVISFLGYSTKTIKGVTIIEGKSFNIGTILLKPMDKLLNEVVVTGERNIVESKTDRLVYNAEKDISNTGGTAVDVLQKAPLVSVDLDGNVKLRGANNVRILINGKPSSIFAVSAADALRQIPADQIKSVELLTNPSVKYDAEGSGGIINIILKRNSLQGLHGSFTSSIGTRNSSLGLTEGFRKNKLALNLNAGLNGFYTRRGAELERRDYASLSQVPSAVLNQQRFQRNLGVNGYSQLSIDYELTPNDLLSAAIQASFLNYRVNANLESQYSKDNPINYYDGYSRNIFNTNKFNNIDFSIGYTKILPKKQELSVLALYTYGKGIVNYTLAEQRNNLVDYREASNNNNPNREITLQADYTHPIKASTTIEFGAKIILRTIQSDFAVYYDSLRGNGALLDTNRSNDFSYQQNIYAAYGSYSSLLFSKYSVKLGVRTEYTKSYGDFYNSVADINNNYANLIPNLTIAREFGEKKTTRIRASYTRRLQRPGIYYLNPFINTQDKQNISAGNPLLGPELTSSYELGLSSLIKSINLNTIIYSRITDNSIEEIARLVPASSIYATSSAEEVRFTTYQNAASNAAYGVSIAASVKLMSKLTASINSTTNYLEISSSSLNTTRTGVVSTLNLNVRWDFSNGLTSQFNYGFNSKNFELQRTISSYQTHSFSIRKDLSSKKGNWGIIIDNPLHPFITIKSTLLAPGLEANNTSYVYMRGVRASLSLTLGGKSNSSNRSSKSINNTDQKQGKNDWQ